MTKIRIISSAFLAIALPLGCAAQGRALSLKECIEISQSQDPTIRNAALDIKAAKAQKKEVLSKYFPEVTARAFGFASIDPLLNIGLSDVLGSTDAANNLKYYAETTAGLAGVNTEWSLLRNGYLAGVSLIQPVFAGGRIVNGNALASLGIKAADIKADMAGRESEDRITTKYWAAVSLAEKKKALLQAEELVASLEKDVRSAVNAGLASPNDLLKVQLKGKELEVNEKRLGSGEKLAKMDLFNAIGMDYKVSELDTYVLSDQPDALQSPDAYRRDEASVAGNLEESKLLELNLESKELEKKMAVGEALPQIGIGAAYGYSKIIGQPRTNGTLYASVSIPLSDWGRASQKIRRCSYEVEKTRNEKEFLDKQLYLKVRKEWMDVECAWDQAEVEKSAVSLAETNEKQVRASYAAGMSTLSEVLQALTELEGARSKYVESRIAYCNAVCVWLK